MKKNKINVAVVMGGYSSEDKISMNSGGTIVDNLNKEKYNVYPIHITKKRWFCYDNNADIDKNDFSILLKNGNKIKFDVVYNAIHGTPGEDGKFQSYLELLDVPHTSSDSFESTITFGKIETKSLLSNFDVINAKMIGIYYDESLDYDYYTNLVSKKIGFPCFVKPNRSGSSFGVSKVYKKDDLKKAILSASQEDRCILVEEFIEGTEISVGVSSIDGNLKVLGITEIIPETDFFDYKAKYEGLSKEITPARLPKHIDSKIEDLTKKIYKLLNLKGICRIDFIIKNDEPYFLEVNTVPGFSDQSIIPQQARYSNISLENLFDNEIQKVIK